MSLGNSVQNKHGGQFFATIARSAQRMLEPSRVLVQRYDLVAFVRYGLVGAGQNALSYLALLGLLMLGWRAWMATALIYPLAVLLSFVVNRAWSFSARMKARGQLVRYVLVYIAVYPLAVGAVWGLEAFGLAGWLASAIVMVIAATGAFALMNTWVFRR